MTQPYPLAIIGAACRLPGGEGLEAFGELLLSGGAAISEIPESRWTKSRYFHPVPGQPGKTYSFAAGCLYDIDAFDAAFFGISPREALSIDPQQRMMLEIVYETIEDAGTLPSRLAGEAVGVFIGASSWDFAAASFSDAAGLDAYAMQGAALSSVANRVSYVFGLHGPSLTVDTACSSSLVALHLACEALRRGEIGMAIVGGVNLLLAPQSFVGFARASMLSRTGRCHPFDARADGYVRAEGGGAIILKPLAQALADGDDIRAVIHGTGINSDGRTSGLALPSREAQAALLKKVYADADISPNELTYFEAHGTGTPVGDPIEAHAIGDALAQHRRLPLPIGSVKSNVGHLEPASGMAGLMKLIIAFANRVVPPSLNFETPNPNIPFEQLNLEVVAKPRDLPGIGEAVLTGINSFGFGGTNAHAIIGAPAPPPPTIRRPENDAATPLLLSARSADALRALTSSWRDTLLQAATDQVSPLLRAAARRREQYAHRMVVAGGSSTDLTARLDAWLADGRAPGVVAGQVSVGRLCFVFSGNGSQWAGMAQDALALSPQFRAALTEVDGLLATELGWSVTDRLADGQLAAMLRDTSVAQPLLFAIQVASVRTLQAHGVQADAYVGHSAGEVAAAWASGALSLPQACHVIIQRSFLQRMTQGAGLMATVDLDAANATSLIEQIDDRLAIAAVNGAHTVTVAGPAEAIQRLLDIAAAENLTCTQLDLDYAFHSAVMDPIRAPLLAGLNGLHSAVPSACMISTVTGTVVAAGELDAEYWWQNVRLPVRFQPAIEQLIDQGVRNFAEIGPQPVLQAYLRDILRRKGQSGQTFGVLSRHAAAVDPFATAAGKCHLAGADLSTAACFQGPTTARGLPGYKWQKQRFSISRTVEAIEAANPRHDHPLLGFRDPQSRDTWMSHLSLLSDPWLGDHALNGATILPAAAMIDMALAAARVRHENATAFEIQDLEIMRPLVLEANVTRDCRTSVAPDGQLTLASRVRLSDETPQPHLVCRIMPGIGIRPILPQMPLDGGEMVEAASVYETAERLHLQYGPAFRTVKCVRRIDADRGVAELMPQGSDRVAAGYLLDPTLVDGSLQAVLVLASDHTHLGSQGSVVPWRFGRVRLLRPQGAQPRQAAVHVRRVGPRSICADIALIDMDGEVVMELIDCWFVSMTTASKAQVDKTFWTAYVPSARQPLDANALSLTRALAAVPSVDEVPASVLLADGFASAAAFEALRPLAAEPTGLLPPEIDAAPLNRTALSWLEEDGFAERTEDGWRLAATTELPPAVEIWSSLFVESPRSSAECAVLASLGPALAGADAAALRLSPVLKEHLLFGSASATTAADALLRAISSVSSAWQAGRCLRIAFAGALYGPLVRRVIDHLAGRGILLRVATWAHDADMLAGAQDIVAQIPGAATRLWATLTDEDRHGFDIVVELFGLSLPDAMRITPEALGSLVAPGGLLLGAEPAESRAANLMFGPAMDPAVAPALQGPDAWCTRLCGAGFAMAQHTLLGGSVWPVALLAAVNGSAAAKQSRNAPPADHGAGLVVFAAPDDPLAGALAARQSVLRLLPIEAMKEALTAPFAANLRHVLLLAADRAEEDGGAETLPELLADISAALLSLPAQEAPRLWLVSPGSPTASGLAAALAGLRRVVANEQPGLDCRAVYLDANLPTAASAERLLQEIADPDDEREVNWQTGGRLVPRLRSGLPQAELADGPRRLEVSRPGLVSSLAWVPAPPSLPGRNEVAIEVRASALNFRDLMWAQALLPDEAVLDGFSGPSLGLECAGVVTATGEGITDIRPGDRVMAVAPATLATHVVTRGNGVMRIPPELDFESAATLPVAFMTAVYALGHLGRLRTGERVLVHAGAGGVGLAAIQYALHQGAVVYATAGSEMRRQVLRMLGVADAFDSRSTSFADDILAATNGEGVDVVLNSLSQDLMQQSIRLLRPFGRFLEIGKRDIYRNTSIGIRPLRHNASYFAIDVDELVAHRPDIGQSVLQEIAGLLANGRLRPLPHRVFGFSEAVSGFRLLQSSGHVGKIVLTPEPTPQVAARPSFSADADGVYLVTGGLAGFGLEAARWLGRNGARKLALLGRRGAMTPGADAALASFATDGIAASAFACDVTDQGQLRPVLARIRQTMGPIRGVLHAAMVLDDGNLQDLDTARFAAVIRPKLVGAVALDRLTREDPIDLFILFSSIAAAIGTPGQANYVAANAALEALAERRRAAGLPALAVQWGPIADAGYLTRESRVSDMLEKMLGSSHMCAAQALDALPALLQCGRTVVGLADVAWGELRSRLPGLAAPLWSEMPAGERRDESGQSIRTRLAALGPDEAAKLILEIIVVELATILQQAPGTIDVDRPIHEFGVDSLMAVELQMALEVRLGLQLPLASLTAAATLRALPARLLLAMQSTEAAQADEVAAALLRYENTAVPTHEPTAGSETEFLP